MLIPGVGDNMNFHHDVNISLRSFSRWILFVKEQIKNIIQLKYNII